MLVFHLRDHDGNTSLSFLSARARFIFFYEQRERRVKSSGRAVIKKFPRALPVGKRVLVSLKFNELS